MWKKTQREINPFKPSLKKGTEERRLRYLLLFFLCSLIGAITLLFFHPFFQITKIEIQGEQRLSEDDIQSATQSILNHRILFVGRGDNYFLANVKEIHEILKERFPISHITVQKHFPEQITIEIQERETALIYENLHFTALIGSNGGMIEIVERNTEQTTPPVSTASLDQTRLLIETLKKQYGNHLVVFDERVSSKQFLINDEVLPAETVQSMIEWKEKMEKQKIPFSYIVLKDTSQEGIIVMNTGQKAQVLFDKTVAIEFERLHLFLEQQKRGSIATFQLVDLRYADRVYWR